MSVNEKVFCLSYFEVKLKKPSGLVHQGMLDVSNLLNLNLLCISRDMTLFMAPMSKSVLILVSKLLFANT